MTTIIQGTLVLTDGLAERGQVVVEDGHIQEVVTGESRFRPTNDFGDGYIVPGFIDLHIHGIAGADVMDASCESLDLMARRFAAHGVTGFTPTTVTENPDLTRRTIATIRDYANNQPPGRARVLGIHLEGPFLNPAYKGMQPEGYIMPPDADMLSSLLELGGGLVRRVSLAPEMPGADSLIRLLRSKDVEVSIAHTGATYEQALAAVEGGARHVTHCFNAMTGLHHRRPGVAGAAMIVDDLYTELIADGIHIHPAVMRLLIRVKGRERVMLVTDAMSATELPDGEYRFGGHEVIVRNGEARLADGTLASSTLTMDGAVRCVIRLCGTPLVDAVYMASTTPAEAMGWGASKGKIARGYDADLTVLDGDLRPMATFVSGVMVPAETLAEVGRHNRTGG